MKHLPYERQGFSQNNETGIIELMLSGLSEPQRTFVEIGFGDGTQNMTLDLLHLGYCGIGIDAHDWDPSVTEHWPDQLIKIKQMITPDTVLNLISAEYQTPDFFSLDIDSFDYEVARNLLQRGFAPAVVCCEINQHFGTQWASFPFIADAVKKTYNKKFHYGCSLQKYQALWASYGYEFFTVDTRAVNAFWFDPRRVTVDLALPRHVDLGPIDPNIIRNQILDHWFWHDRSQEIYQ